MVKAYAKNNDMDSVKTHINEWVQDGYLNEDTAEELQHQAELLNAHRIRLPISEDFKKSKDNYLSAVQVVDKKTVLIL